jgi:pilus assembly protein CpaE
MAATARRAAEVATGEAILVAVYAPKGGSGRTTIALNLAAELARGRPGEVLVVDLDLPFTPAALLSGLVPEGSLTRASWAGMAGGPTTLTEELINAVQLHPTGYVLLPGVLRVEESELVTSEQVTDALRALSGSYRYIVADLGSSLSGITLGVCEMARELVVVVTPELPSLKGARDVLRILHESLYTPDERIHLVLNHRQAETVVPRESVHRTLGRTAAVEIGYDGTKSERAALAGTVLVATDPKSEMAKAAKQLATLVAGERQA